MNFDLLAANAACIQREADWFRQILELRMRIHAGEQASTSPLAAFEPPPLPPGVPYAEAVRGLGLEPEARLVLILSLLPHVRPELLDSLSAENPALQRRFPEFGGVRGSAHSGILPTGETAIFLLAGGELEARLRFLHLFRSEHPLYTQNVLRLERRHPEEPALASILQLTPEYVERLTTGGSYQPPFSAEFPAQRLTTSYSWEELIVERSVKDEIDEIVAWVRHERRLLEDWGLRKQLKPGFRSLFYGPPGTGKTLTASLIGKETEMPVYRVDLSKVVSKYIGETEKNLASLFDHAQHQRWILFFDEADSLFGKRTESRDANDRAANQQISYLLQRIEDFPGVVLLATNARSRFDEAFARRFQSMIYFPMPGVEQRLRLWRANFVGQSFRLAPGVDFEELARAYELSGGSIINVLRAACLKAAVRTSPEIRQGDLLQGINKELLKEGKAPRAR